MYYDYNVYHIFHRYLHYVYRENFSHSLPNIFHNNINNNYDLVHYSALKTIYCDHLIIYHVIETFIPSLFVVICFLK